MCVFMHLLFSIVFLLEGASSDYRLIIVHGKPKTYSSVNINSSLSWSQCQIFCLQEPKCVVAYNGKSDKCQWFVHQNLTVVEPTTKREGHKVGFKINRTSAECPTGRNPPTFDNKEAIGSVRLYFREQQLASAIQFNYTIRFLQGIWAIDYALKLACPSRQFVLVQRAAGVEYCIALQFMTKSEPTSSASIACSYMSNSVFTGVTTAAEFIVMKSILVANRENPQILSRNFLLRVDGQRTATCQAAPTTAPCMTAKGFQFSDPLIKTVSSYQWVTNAGARTTAASNCIVMVVNGNKPILADVQSCNADTTLPAIAFMCGRPAWAH